MSDVVAVALITGTITGLVGLAGLLANIWNSQRDRELRLEERRGNNTEWYKRALFEKRLQAAQEAYAWLMKLNRGLNSADDPTNADAEWTQKLRQWCLDSRDWYDSNAVFLYASLPQSSELIGLINAASHYASGRGDMDWKQFIDADKEIRARLDEVLAGGADDSAF